MTLRPRRRPPVDINIAPLLDVVFLLLIFFMVSTTFTANTQLRLQLPTANGVPAPTETPVLRIIIDASGQFIVNNQSVNNAQALTQVLRELAAARPPAAAELPPLLLQADARTPHQAVMTALDAASHAGFVRIAFAALSPDRSAP
jgi:biopolymer transport protein ExbD